MFFGTFDRIVTKKRNHEKRSFNKTNLAHYMSNNVTNLNKFNFEIINNNFLQMIFQKAKFNLNTLKLKVKCKLVLNWCEKQHISAQSHGASKSVYLTLYGQRRWQWS